MPLTERQKWILGGSLLFGSIAIYIQSSKHPLIRPTKIVYPPKSGGTRFNRIYQIVRDPSDLEPLIITKPPLLLNFVRLGEPSSNKITEALQDIVGKRMPTENRAVSMVSIETDNLENIPLTVKYGVKDIPAIVCLKKQLPSGQYRDEKLEGGESVNVEELTKWVREHSDALNEPESKENGS